MTNKDKWAALKINLMLGEPDITFKYDEEKGSYWISRINDSCGCYSMSVVCSQYSTNDTIYLSDDRTMKCYDCYDDVDKIIEFLKDTCLDYIIEGLYE